ncbi:MAG: amidohydrolase family protein [Candidatus Aenigmarchaeota archaeon]|nr:amidohydrolase family protein [Candidatus Aenigmarchaeota archaeon]
MEYKEKRIDVHEHFRKGGNVDVFLKFMEKFSIEKVVFVPTGKPPLNSSYRANMQELFRLARIHAEIIPFATVCELEADPLKILHKAIEKGARGLKLIGYHPLFRAPPLTSKKMKRIFRTCREFRLPVLIHINLYDLKHLQQFEEILDEFKEVNFIAAHYAKLAKEKIRLGLCSKLLGKHKNLFVDTSMGGGTKIYLKNIHYQPILYRKFMIKNKRRILWGSDCVLRKESKEKTIDVLLSTHIDVLEKEKFISRLSLERIELYGLNLPKQVLNYIYYKNPKKVLHL